MTEPSHPPSEHRGSICPHCGTPRVHRSHCKGLTERLLFLVGARVRRCRACDVRFARLFGSAVCIDDARRVLRRAAIVLLMVAGVVLVLIVVLWLINEQAAIRPSD